MSCKDSAINTILYNKLSVEFIFNDLMVRKLDSKIVLRDKYNIKWNYKLVYTRHYNLYAKTDEMQEWECIA
jgi:hypothetical protein